MTAAGLTKKVETLLILCDGVKRTSVSFSFLQLQFVLQSLVIVSTVQTCLNKTK